jgi:hypothetical protein
MTLHYGLSGGVPTTDDPALLEPIKGYARGLTKSPTPGAPETWAVGRAELADGEVLDMPVSWTDVGRDVIWSTKMLRELGIGSGDFVFFSLTYRQSAQFWPWMKATFDIGGRLATGSVFGWDATRLEMYMRRFTPKIVIGIGSGTLDSLESQGFDIGKIYQRPETLVTLPECWDRMVAAGYKPWRLAWVGPILTLDPCDGTGARFDYDQWKLEGVDGQISVTSIDRMTSFDRARTGVKGEIRTVDGEPRFFAA